MSPIPACEGCPDHRAAPRPTPPIASDATAARPAPAPRRSLPLRSLLAASVLVPALYFAAAAWHDHGRRMAEARATVERTAAVAQEHAYKVIETNALVLDRMEDRVRGLAWDEILARQEELHRDLRALDDAIAQMGGLHLIAPDGRLAVISIAYPTPAQSLADRAYFRRHASGGVLAGRLDFGEPVVGRSSGVVAFTMSRRRAGHADDRFDGLVVGSILPGAPSRRRTGAR